MISNGSYLPEEHEISISTTKSSAKWMPQEVFPAGPCMSPQASPLFPSRPSPHPSSPLPLAPRSQTPVLEMSLNVHFRGKAHAHTSVPPLFRPPRHLLDEFCLYEPDWAVCPLVVRVSRREAWTQEPRERQTGWGGGTAAGGGWFWFCSSLWPWAVGV